MRQVHRCYNIMITACPDLTSETVIFFGAVFVLVSSNVYFSHLDPTINHWFSRSR